MNISYHPDYKREAGELREFLKEKGITLDVNYVIGGDGTLFTYLSTTQPNLLISPKSSVGYYASIHLGSHFSFIEEYARNPVNYHQVFNSIKARVNGVLLPQVALNDVLVTEGLHHLSRFKVKGSEVLSSGLLVYTPQGFGGMAHSAGAKKHEPLGLIGLLVNKGEFKESVAIKSVKIKLMTRHRPTHYQLFFDCKEVEEYDENCTDREEVYHQPVKLEPGDVLRISLGPEVIIVKQ